MALKFTKNVNGKPYFVTFSVVDNIDIFIRKQFRDIFYESTNYCIKNKGLNVFCYCIMTSHIHLIIGTDDKAISDIIRDWKAYTSRHIRKCLESAKFESRKYWLMKVFKYKGTINPNNKDFQFWQQNNHPIQLNSNFIVEQKVEYIHNNPVNQGFVEKPEYWLHSSANFYSHNAPTFINLTKFD